MKIIKNVKNNRFLVVLGLVLVLLSVETMAMQMSEAAIKYAKARIIFKKRVDELKPDEYFVFQAGTMNGVVVPLDALNKSIAFKGMLKHRDTQAKRIIPIPKYSIGEIKLVCDALKTDTTDTTDKTIQQSIQNLPLDKLFSRANLFNVFGMPDDVIKILLAKVKADIISGNENINENIDVLNRLDEDLQRSLMINPVIDNLKSLIMQSKMNRSVVRTVTNTNKFNIHSLAFNSNGNKIVSGGDNDLILWNISNPDKITFRPLTNKDKTGNRYWRLVKFSPDSNKIISAEFGGNLCLWDVRDLEKITPKELANMGRVDSVAFSSDGSTMAVGSFMGRLTLWNVSELEKISSQELKGGVQPDIAHVINTVAFHPKGKKFAFGGKLGTQSNLMLYDIDKKIFQNIEGSQGVVNAVAFSPDGKKFASGGDESLILWDYRESKFIPYPLGEGFQGSIKSLGFSSDSRTMFSCHQIKDGNFMFALWNISDLKNVYFKTIEVSNEQNVFAVISPEGNRIATGGSPAFGIAFYLFILLTDDQIKLINDINDYSIEKIRLLYELYIQSLRNQSISPERLDQIGKVFKTLPSKMQDLLDSLGLFKKQGWFSWRPW